MDGVYYNRYALCYWPTTADVGVVSLDVWLRWLSSEFSHAIERSRKSTQCLIITQQTTDGGRSWGWGRATLNQRLSSVIHGDEQKSQVTAAQPTSKHWKIYLKCCCRAKRKLTRPLKYGDQKVSYIQQPPLSTRTPERERGRGTEIQVPDMAQQKVAWGFPATRAVGRVSSHTSC